MMLVAGIILLLISLAANSLPNPTNSPTTLPSLIPSPTTAYPSSPTISPTTQPDSLGAHSNGIAAGLIVGVFLILGIGIAINAGEKKSADEQSKINSSFSKLEEAQELEEK